MEHRCFGVAITTFPESEDKIFQSTLPRGERLLEVYRNRGDAKISIHAPAR